jgi:hypothetical protein
MEMRPAQKEPRPVIFRSNPETQTTLVVVLVVAGLIFGSPALAAAQQRPLVTEDPETIGAGRMLVEAGIDYLRDVDYPVSGLEGNLRRFPVIGISFGLGSIGEAQIDGSLYNHLSITERRPGPLAFMVDRLGSTTTDAGDLVVGTKVRLVSEGVSRPSIALRSATRLPMASNESGLGLDTTDFFSSMLIAKTVESVRVVGNIGLGILGDPTRGDRQNDVLTYGLSFARALTQRAEVVGEVNGHVSTREGEPPPGTDSRGVFRVGARYTTGPVRADAALLVGILSEDPRWGMTAGFTYVFNAFQTP